MPFTPFHLGPGLACKALLGERFSFMVFGGAQVLMDIEPLIGILRGDAILHGSSHTVAGALLIGAVAALTGKPVSLWCLRRFHNRAQRLGWRAACSGAFLGTFSHILFDGIMHADMRPWWPFAQSNDLLGMLALGPLHLLCLALGIIGIIGILIVKSGKGTS